MNQTFHKLLNRSVSYAGPFNGARFLYQMAIPEINYKYGFTNQTGKNLSLFDLPIAVLSVIKEYIYFNFLRSQARTGSSNSFKLAYATAIAPKKVANAYGQDAAIVIPLWSLTHPT